MNRNRKKLIEELIRVGRLIDPAPDTGLSKGADDEYPPGISQRPDIDGRSPLADLEDLPILDDVVDPTYTTKDMFDDPMRGHTSRLAISLEKQQPAANASSSIDIHANERVGLVVTDLGEQHSPASTEVGFPVEELARELVTLIEDRVSQRSGEQLDDAFRDELTQAVIKQLEGWLKHG